MHRIISGVKIHTIRADKGKRWRVGMTAQMWMHSPRNVAKNPFQFGTAEIDRIIGVKISKAQHCAWFMFEKSKYWHPCDFTRLAVNDGFDDAGEFFEWFGEFEGRLIIWKNFVSYNPELRLKK